MFVQLLTLQAVTASLTGRQSRAAQLNETNSDEAQPGLSGGLRKLAISALRSAQAALIPVDPSISPQKARALVHHLFDTLMRASSDDTHENTFFDKVWMCPVCTLENPRVVTVCAACESARPCTRLRHEPGMSLASLIK